MAFVALVHAACEDGHGTDAERWFQVQHRKLQEMPQIGCPNCFLIFVWRFFVEIFLSSVAGGGEVWSDAHGESLYTSGAFLLLERELV